MNKCLICGKDSGKGKTCGSTCRSKLARSVAKGIAQQADATVETVGIATPSSRTETPEGFPPKVPANYGQPDCECMHCQTNGNRHIINHGSYKTAGQLARNELNRVSLPGDVDYHSVPHWTPELREDKKVTTPQGEAIYLTKTEYEQRIAKDRMEAS